MSFRVSALAAVAAVLGLASVTPASAQPQPPVRPRYSQFQAVFRPGASPLIYPGQGVLGPATPFNPYGPQAPGFVYPQSPYLPGPYGISPYGVAPTVVGTTGVVGTFGNLGHWYGGNYGNYGHWYPNGVANGRGVVGYGVGLPGVGGGLIAGPGGGVVRPGGSLLGTAATLGATVGTFRR